MSNPIVNYGYTGYLQTILRAPDLAARESLAYVEFSADDLARWDMRDLANFKQWNSIPAHKLRTDDGVQLSGRFEDVRRMDALDKEDPNYWVPLSSLGLHDERFPIDLGRFPIAEITYRCTSENAWPAWVWTYEGGLHLDMLPRVHEWTTLARRVPHFGFPERIDTFILRLYTTTRSSESIEVQAIRFREMSRSEREACQRDEARLKVEAKPKSVSTLDEFLPLGVCMDVKCAQRNAQGLGLTQQEYWRLALEDISTHHHNCIAIDNVDHLTQAEWNDFLTLVYEYHLRVVPSLRLPIDQRPEQLEAAIRRHIQPHILSSSILAWNIFQEPRENRFQQLLRAKARVEEVDPNHPVAVMTRHPSEFPLYAPFFSVSGVNHLTSHSPWDMADIVRKHRPLCGGQQFWISAPTFTYGTGLPEWNTCPELRLMLNLSFANGARGWFSFMYHNDPIWGEGSYERTLTGPFLTFSDLWLELDRRMEVMNALAPLLLQCDPRPLPDKWYVTSAEGQDINELPEGVPPTNSYRLRGPDYNLYMVVSNDIRGMSSLTFHVPREALLGMQIYDLTDFIQSREWRPMQLDRHVEMFPGQVQVFVVADEAVCNRLRDTVAERLIEDDRRLLEFNLRLTRAYNLDVSDVESLVNTARNGNPLKALSAMDRARDRLVSTVYASPEIYQPRSIIIQASSGLCACDGVLCRLMARGRGDEAQAWGERVMPLARDLARMRVELRAGRGASISQAGAEVKDQILKILADLRAI